MPLVIWKTKLAVADVQEIYIPRGAEFLHVHNQDNGRTICVWYRCDSDADNAPRTIVVAGTGNPRPVLLSDDKYIGTAHLYGGDLVFHVFERVS